MAWNSATVPAGCAGACAARISLSAVMNRQAFATGLVNRPAVMILEPNPPRVRRAVRIGADVAESAFRPGAGRALTNGA